MTDYNPEDYINYRINKAQETIQEVEKLIYKYEQFKCKHGA